MNTNQEHIVTLSLSPIIDDKSQISLQGAANDAGITCLYHGHVSCVPLLYVSAQLLPMDHTLIARLPLHGWTVN